MKKYFVKLTIYYFHKIFAQIVQEEITTLCATEYFSVRTIEVAKMIWR